MGNFIKSDVNIIAMFLDGQEINDTPENNDYLVSVTCDKKAEAYWDNEAWGLMIKNFEKGIKCSVYFESKYLTNYIKYLENTSEDLLYDETEDKNLRYIGANPNNYVLFNNELWRIVGVMNDVKNDQNISETRVKIVRDSSIGNYAWDYKADGTYGKDWNTATIRELLNGPYYNKTTGTYYNASTTPTNVDFTTIGLSEEARKQIEASYWDSSSIAFHALPKYSYQKKNFYLDYIGLPNISDLAFSVQGGETTSRNECLNMELYNGWIKDKNCSGTSWIRKGSTWTINNGGSVCIAVLNGNCSNSNSIMAVTPSVYLKSNVYYVSGTGSSTDPFIIR